MSITNSNDRSNQKSHLLDFLDAYGVDKGFFQLILRLSIAPNKVFSDHINGIKFTNAFKYSTFVVTISILLSLIKTPNSSDYGITEIGEYLIFYVMFLAYSFICGLYLYIFRGKSQYGIQYMEFTTGSLYLISHAVLIVSFIEVLAILLYFIFEYRILLDLPFNWISPGIIILFTLWGSAYKSGIGIGRFLLTQLLALLTFFGVVLSFFRIVIPWSGLDYFIFKEIENTHSVIGAITLAKEFEQYEKGEMSYDEFMSLQVRVDSIQINGPAYEAGMKKGDLILRVNGLKTYNKYFDSDINIHKPDEEIILTIYRGDSEIDVSLKLAHRDSVYKE